MNYRSKPTYSLWRPARVNYKRNRIKAKFAGELVQFDLADFQQTKEKIQGKTMNWLLVAVDSYSRYVFTVPLTDRKSKNIIEAMKTIFATGYKPEQALADPAGEHVSRETKKFFKDSGVHLYHTTSKIHAPQVKLFNTCFCVFITQYYRQNAGLKR